MIGPRQGALAALALLIVLGTVPAASHAARSEVTVANAEPVIEAVHLSAADGGRGMDVTVHVRDDNGVRDLRSVRVGIDVGASVTTRPVPAHRVGSNATWAAYDATIRDDLWLLQQGWGRLQIVAVDAPGARTIASGDPAVVDAALGADRSAPLEVAGAGSGAGDGLAFHAVGLEAASALCPEPPCELTAREAAAVDRWLEIGRRAYRWSPVLVDLAASVLP